MWQNINFIKGRLALIKNGSDNNNNNNNYTILYQLHYGNTMRSWLYDVVFVTFVANFS